MTKALDTRRRTVSIPVLNVYQVETLERMVFDDPGSGQLYPVIVPKTVTDKKARLAIAVALQDLARLKRLGLIKSLGQSDNLELLALTEKGHLLFNVEHERTTSIQ